MTALPRVADIKRLVARHYGVTPAMMDMRAPRGTRRVNTWDIARPRQVAMALSWLLTGHSQIRIGHFFGGRHPTTVRHACDAVAKRRRGDPKLHNAMRRMSLELVRG